MLAEAPATAAAVLLDLYGAAEPLARFPRLGRAVPGFDDVGLRELIHRQYRIVYEIEGQTVTVLAVFHSAMDVESRLRQMLLDD